MSLTDILALVTVSDTEAFLPCAKVCHVDSCKENTGRILSARDKSKVSGHVTNGSLNCHALLLDGGDTRIIVS